MKIIKFWGINTLSILILLAGFCVGALHAATITVDSNDDIALPSNDGDCTLREAIKAAEDNAAVDGCAAGSGADTIIFDPAADGIHIEAGDLSNAANPITESLTIQGNGVDNFIHGDNSSWNLFYFNSPGNNQTFNISKITLLEGRNAVDVDDGETLNVMDTRFQQNSSTSGAAINIQPAVQTAPITVNIKRSTFIGNQAQSPSSGGAIRGSINSTISIENSTFSENISLFDGGAIVMACSFGGIAGSCQLDIEHSTFSANRANRGGGAFWFSGSSSAPLQVSIKNSTITANVADDDQVFASFDDGGGILYFPANMTLTLTNTVVAGNIDNSTSGITDFDDISSHGSAPGTFLVSNGFNLIGNNADVTTEFPAGTPNANNDYVGMAAAILSPNLQPLADNGGPTQTHLPSVGSPLIDAGFCTGANQDQRGFGNNDTNMRVVDDPTVTNGTGSDGCDIGAVELGAELIDLSTGGETCYAIKAASGNVTVFCM